MKFVYNAVIDIPVWHVICLSRLENFGFELWLA